MDFAQRTTLKKRLPCHDPLSFSFHPKKIQERASVLQFRYEWMCFTSALECSAVFKIKSEFNGKCLLSCSIGAVIALGSSPSAEPRFFHVGSQPALAPAPFLERNSLLQSRGRDGSIPVDFQVLWIQFFLRRLRVALLKVSMPS